MSRFLILILFVCAAANAGLREDLIDKYSLEFIRANAQYNYMDIAGEPSAYMKGRRDVFYEVTDYLWTLPDTSGEFRSISRKYLESKLSGLEYQNQDLSDEFIKGQIFAIEELLRYIDPYS